MSLWLWPSALVIGVVLGLFGAGGGMITVPVLIYLADMPVKEAIAMSLWVVAIVSLTALIQQRVWRNLQARLLITFGVTGVLGSVIGSLLAVHIDEDIQLILFALLILLVTWWLSRVELSDRVSVFRFIPASVTGLFIGVITGVLGVGGGFLLVPALIYLGVGHFPIAVAHSLVLITLNATAGGITYLKTVNFSLPLALIISIIAALGTVLGTYLLRKLPGVQLQRAFSMMLILIGGFMLLRTGLDIGNH